MDLIHPQVSYVFLGKQRKLDLLALGRLVRYIKSNRIQIVHAHSSSIFFAALAKMFCSFHLVWHDHYGLADQLENRRSFALKRISPWIDHIWSVNENLRDWAIRCLALNENQCVYLPNFPDFSPTPNASRTIDFPGKKSRRILCVANFRPQKDHPNLFGAFQIVLEQVPDAHLFLVGKSFGDKYAQDLHDTLAKHSDNIHYLGARTDIAALLPHFEIGVLVSWSEGLPLALLEYGLARLAVITTDVGQCASVLGNPRYLVEPKQPEKLAHAIINLLCDDEGRQEWAKQFHERVNTHFSREACLRKITDQYSAWFTVEP